MTFEQWGGIGGGVLLIAFIVFAFRQGFSVKPTGRNTRDNVSDAVNLMADRPPDP